VSTINNGGDVVMSLIINNDESLSASKVVSRFGLLRGEGGRWRVLSAANSAMKNVVEVQETWFPPPEGYVESAVIENLIIDGNDPNFAKGVTGILLENVCKCQVLNVTIRNCEVGIHIRLRDGLWSEGNCLRHIRMENVKIGILFTTTGPFTDPNMDQKTLEEMQEKCPGNSAGFTTIDDVGIELADRSDAVGIQIGGVRLSGDVDTTLIMPYSSRIRANVWLGYNGGTGLKLINGTLGYVQAHLTVHKNELIPIGTGIDLHSFKPSANYNPVNVEDINRVFDVYRPVWDNQRLTVNSNGTVIGDKGFVLVTSNIVELIREPSHIGGRQVKLETDIQTTTF